MKTLVLFLRLLPLLLRAIREIELELPISGVGKEKLGLILAVIQTVYDAEEELRREFTWERLAGIVEMVVSTVVATFNKLGVFKHAPPTIQ